MTQAAHGGKGAPSILLRANLYRACWREFGLRPREVDRLPTTETMWLLEALHIQDEVQRLRTQHEARAAAARRGRGRLGPAQLG